MTKLYKEKVRPRNPIDYIRLYFDNPEGYKINELKKDNTELKEKLKKLQEAVVYLNKENENLKDQIYDLEN